jgi:nicotinamide-nucleotide amidase
VPATETEQLAAGVLASAQAHGLKIAVAESLTGGLVSSALTAQAGASKVFLGGVVAYQNEVKAGSLGVSQDLLDTDGPISATVATQMSLGVRNSLAKQCGVDEQLVVGLATTGLAGPESIGGKPVGLVYVSLTTKDLAFVRELNLGGNRQRIREQAVRAVFKLFLEQFPL